jgi:hypothetical protein
VGEEDKDKVLEERNRKQGILPFDFFFVYGEGGKWLQLLIGIFSLDGWEYTLHYRIRVTEDRRMS